MGKAMVVLVIATSLLLGCANLCAAYYGDEEGAKPSNQILVGGKVLCQDCTKGWNKWINGATPIKGSVVAITCMDERNRIVRYARDETDDYGRFDFAVNMTCGITSKRIDPKLCRARLVSSPDPSCDVFTNFGGGLDGVRLTRPSSVYRDIIRFTLDPFYFTSPMCEKPNLGNDEEDGDKGHY